MRADRDSAKDPRILELDGIRGVAVLAVVLFHYTIIGSGASFHRMRYMLRRGHQYNF